MAEAAAATNGQAPVDTRELTSHTRGNVRYLYGSPQLLASKDPVLVREAFGRLAAYRDLERDAKVYASLQKRYDMTVNAPMLIKPGLRRGMSERRIDRKAAEMIRDQLENMGAVIESAEVDAHAQFASDFDAIQYGMLDAALMGYAVGEIMWVPDGNQLVAAEIRVRDQERFKFDTQHRLRLLEQGDLFQGKTLPSRKMLVFTFGSFSDPYGLSLGYRLYWPVRFKRLSMSYWLRFLDKYGGPTAVGKYPPGTTEDKQEQLLEAAAAIQSDSALVIPDTQVIELLEGIKTAAQSGYEQISGYLDSQIAQIILGVTLTTEISSQGSRAATETHRTEQREEGKKDSTFLMNFFRATLIRWIIDYNFGDDVPAPRLIKLFPDLSALKEWSQIDNTLGQLGYKRKLSDVNRLYGYGEEVFEEKPLPAAVPPTQEETGSEGGQKSQEERPKE